MSSSDTIKARRYAEEAKIAAATAKLYSKNNESYSLDAAASAEESAGYANDAESSASISMQYYEYSGGLGQWNIGPSATEPESRRDGSAIQVGDIYKNTSDNSVYSFNTDGTWSSVSYDLDISRDLYSASEDMYAFNLSQSEVNITDAGVYESGIIYISDDRQQIVKGGARYYVSPSAAVPFYTTGTTDQSWETDKANFIGLGDVDILPAVTAVQDVVSQMQSGDFSVSPYKNLLDRMQSTGMFPYTEIPGESKGIAGIVIGGSGANDNRSAIMIDERGRIQTYSMVGGMLTAIKVAVPFTEGTGYFNNQFEDRVARFPSAGQEDDDLSPGLLFTWDSTARKYRVGVMSPFMAGNKGYPVGIDQMNLLAGYYDVGYGLNHSFDHFFTNDTSYLQWGKVCTISTGSGVKKLSALITTGSYVNYEQGTYLLDVNGQNLLTTLAAGNINSTNIAQWVKLSRVSSSTNEYITSNYIPEVGLVYNSTTGNAEVWMKVPVYSPLISFTVLSMDSSGGYISVDWSSWSNNSLSTTAPSGIIYATTETNISSCSYVKVNSGEVLYSPNKVMRVKDAMSSSSTYNRMSDFLEYGFTSYSDYFAMNKSAGSGITVNRSATGTYSVSGATLSTSVWRVKQPISFIDGSQAATVAITASASGTFSFTVKDSSGSLVNIPDGTWVDFQVS